MIRESSPRSDAADPQSGLKLPPDDEIGTVVVTLRACSSSAGSALVEGVNFRRARESDARELTQLAVASKRYWGYPEDLIALWLPDLEFTPESIRTHSVIIAEQNGSIVGVVAISHSDTRAELEGLWVDPTQVRRGLGRALFREGIVQARAHGATSLLIDSDPNAEAFYLRLGARRTGSVPSTPPGRNLPRLVVRIDTETSP